MTATPRPTIPLLVTMDLEIAADHDICEQGDVLDRLRNDLQAIGVPLTVFATSTALSAFPNQALALQRAGHDFGLHGKTHGPEENFRIMPYPRAIELISSATTVFEEILATRPRIFRGPAMTTSASTHAALLANGYRGDFSVCPQRLDMLTASGFEWGWLGAPRRPYLASDRSPFRPGQGRMLMVPLSSACFPFVSGMLYLFGLAFMKLLFRLFLYETRMSGGPIVYLFHSYEFSAFRSGGNQKRLHRFYTQDREKRYTQNLALIRYMAVHAGMQPVTGHRYVDSFAGPNH
jgi:hypothetical protein